MGPTRISKNMYCPACGERQITRSRFCSSCGLALNKVHTILDEIEIKQPAATPAIDTVSFSVPTPIEEVERQMIILTLKKNGWQQNTCCGGVRYQSQDITQQTQFLSRQN